MSQVDKLRKAGCVRSDELADDLKKKIEGLSDHEVQTLIDIRNKLKPDDKSEEISPQVF